MPLVETPPLSSCELIVTIPVRDEEDRLLETLTALAQQIGHGNRPLDPSHYEIILLINNSIDASAAIARSFAHAHPSLALHVVEIDLPSEDAHVGRARRILMDTACERLESLGRDRGVIAMTDADTVVAADWIAAMLGEFDAGADVVAGRILVDPAGFADHDQHARQFHLRDVTYRYLVAEVEARLAPDPFDPLPRHFQHFGPSMAVTAAMYRRVGGIPPLPSLEDVAFYDALRDVGARIRHAPSVRVTTSARPDGRTGFGFAVQLRLWSEMGARDEPLLVESLPAIIDRVAGPHRSWMAVERASGWPRVPIDVAIGELRRYLGELRLTHLTSVHALEEVQPVRLLAAAD